jgi:hypothetical protein
MTFGALVSLGALSETRVSLTGRIFVVLLGSFVGALEGLILAFPLAPILGLFRGRS